MPAPLQSSVSVLPKEKKTFNLKVEVPLKVNKGNYHFVVYAGNAKLPLDVVVAQKGTYQTEFTTDQPNMQGNSKSTFTFSATLKNQTADQQLYALMANAPRGWNVVFKPNYKQATSAQVEANHFFHSASERLFRRIHNQFLTSRAGIFSVRKRPSLFIT